MPVFKTGLAVGQMADEWGGEGSTKIKKRKHAPAPCPGEEHSLLKEQTFKVNN